MKCERGECLVCGKIISTPCESCRQAWRNTEEYTHVQVKWSNGSMMDVAVCVGCAKGRVWEVDKREMTEAIWEAWDRQGGAGSYDRGVVIV